MYNNIMDNPQQQLRKAKSLPLNPFKKVDLTPQGPGLKGLRRSGTYPPNKSFTQEEKNMLLQIFNDNKEKYIKDIEDEKILAEIGFYRQEGKKGIYYFIGRLNPPHEGHIETLKNLIKAAIKTQGQVIILLGSGPNKGARTLDDPLPFELKKDIIISLLGNLYEKYKDNISILEMSNAATQLQFNISKIIESSERIKVEIIREIQTFRYSGNKDGGEDVKKLNWVENCIKKKKFVNKDGSEIILETNVVPVDAVENAGRIAMSATRVRKDALIGFIDNPDTGYQSFFQKYGKFYGVYTQPVYRAIVDQAAGLSQEQIHAYIDTGVLPRRGGSRKRKLTKSRKTKRRKSRKHRKTKRRRH